MTEELRPICLYVETCLDRKKGKRDCAKCEHHLNYWTEVMIRDMEKNITRLEQENKELKKRLDSYAISATVPTVMYNRCERERCKYGSALEEIKTILDKECGVIANAKAVGIINEVLE